MNNKGPLIVLLVVAVGLGIALIVVKKQAGDQAKDAANNLTVASNTVVSDKKQLAELQTVNQTLETNLLSTRNDFSNKLAQSDSDHRATEAGLEKEVAEAKAETKAQADSNAVVLGQRDQRISELETQNHALDNETASLRLAITNLDSRIAETQTKLAKSEGDRSFLTKQLQMLKAEKQSMEKRINDIALVRDQLRKLNIDASVDRRLESRRQKMYASFNDIHPAPAPAAPEDNGANVELRQGGGVKIQIPTNAPPK
ncbi:MAG TPA: hypothetical protein VGO59_04130 [Verrucomicrobiae bacterium]